MRSSSINSRTASQRSHSLTLRCTSGSGVRRRSGRGGKSGARAPALSSLLAFVPFQPDQKTEAQHHRDRLAMKAIESASPDTDPTPTPFSLLHDIAPPSGADAHTRPGRREEWAWENCSRSISSPRSPRVRDADRSANRSGADRHHPRAKSGGPETWPGRSLDGPRSR